MQEAETNGRLTDGRSIEDEAVRESQKTKQQVEDNQVGGEREVNRGGGRRIGLRRDVKVKSKCPH